MRILIAEDERDLNRIVSSRLEEEHYSVDSCFDGGEALEYLDSAGYDAVVLDIMMPEAGRPDSVEEDARPRLTLRRCCC